jgi:two-component system, NarL family, response regulator NreC
MQQQTGDLDAQASDPDARITVLLADDHPIVRSGLRRLLEAEGSFRVVAEAGDVAEALRRVRGYKPDVLVLDVSMPGGPSVNAIPQFREASPDTRIVVLTMDAEPVYARTAMRSGALGFVLKEAADSELVAAVHAAAVGSSYLNPRLGAMIAALPDRPPPPPDNLSEREVEVLKLIALGHTNAEVADRLYLSVRTVESHRTHIQQKIGRATRAELVTYAQDHGLVESEQSAD